MELNNQYIGSFIKFMRRKGGLTQQELARRIGVEGKTISKWEQGRGIPDISLLYNLSLELDVDIESLLAGNLEEIGKEWIGIVCVNKESEPGINEREWECMVSMFLLAGIRNVAVLCTNADKEKSDVILRKYRDRGVFRRIYSTDSPGGLIQYIKTEKKHICLLSQPALLYGMNLTRYMRRAMLGGDIRVLAMRHGKGSFMQKIAFDNHFVCTGLGEKADGEWHMFPMFFGTCKRITDYLEQTQGERCGDMDDGVVSKCFSPMSVEAMERGMLAFSFQTKRSRILSGQVLSGIEESQDIKIGDLEEIMNVRGWK